jgi:hypothetical protein
MTRTRVETLEVFNELATAPRWVCWREEERGGRKTKVPYATTGRKASSTDPATWATYEDAIRVCGARGYDGVGIVLGDGLGGVDLDGCRNPDTGELTPWARKILDEFRSYAEVSPSGTGVKVFAYGAPSDLPANMIPMDTPPINGKRPAIECYTQGRYFAVTGRILDGMPDEIRDCGEVGDAWDRLTRLLAGRSKAQDRTPGQPTGAEEMSLGLCEALGEDPRLRALWEEGHEGGGDRSRNDAALASTLAVKGFGDEDIEAALRSYPLGQIGQGALTGSDADRQIGRLLGLAAEARTTRNGTDPAPPPRLPRLPDTFWDERPVLAKVRQAAHARNRSADAVFFAVLARIAAFRPPQMVVDTGIASPASLNLLVAFVDPSGGGKSSPEKIARRLVPAHPDYEDADGLPLGSGEGLAEAYMGTTLQPREDDPAKMEKVRAQVRWNALFYADEGQVLSRLSERKGATLGESLRRAFNGETLGQTNASNDRTRRVRDYSLGLIAGLQPAAAIALLEEADYGTPQRFLWSSVIDPSIPDVPPEWPAELGLHLLEGSFKPFTIDPGICDELRRDDTARQRGELQRNPLDAHEPLCKVKVAGALAVLADRHNITREDWRLAGTIWETSCAVRDTIADYGRALIKARMKEETQQHAHRTVAADRAVQREQAAVERVAGIIARRLIRINSATRRDFTQAVKSKDRRHLDRAIAYAVRREWILEDDDGGFTPGRYKEAR